MTETKRRLHHRLKWPLLAFGIIALCLFEGMWRFRVESGSEQKAVSQWIEKNDYIQRAVGRIDSIEIKRYRSKFSWGFGGETSGRFHFLVKGAKAQMDVLVSWHQSASEGVKIDKLASLDNEQTETIWSPQK